MKIWGFWFYIIIPNTSLIHQPIKFECIVKTNPSTASDPKNLCLCAPSPTSKQKKTSTTSPRTTMKTTWTQTSGPKQTASSKSSKTRSQTTKIQCSLLPRNASPKSTRKKMTNTIQCKIITNPVSIQKGTIKKTDLAWIQASKIKIHLSETVSRNRLSQWPLKLSTADSLHLIMVTCLLTNLKIKKLMK